MARLTASGPGASPPGEWPAELSAEVLERYAAGESGGEDFTRVSSADESCGTGSLGLAQSSVYGVLEECALST